MLRVQAVNGWISKDLVRLFGATAPNGQRTSGAFGRGAAYLVMKFHHESKT
jgi:hypothetical protein